MSNLTVRGNALGTGTVIVESPNTNTNRTLTLPDATTTLVGTDATQTLTNKTINGGTLTLGTVQASTSGTAIDFTGIPSWAKRVTVLLNGVSTNGLSNWLLQLGAGSVATSGYAALGSNYAAGGVITQTTSTSGFLVVAGAASVVASGAIRFNLLTGNTWIGDGLLVRTDAAVSNTSGGSVTLSGTLDRIRVTTVSGTDTFDAGTINIMWEG